MLKTNYSLKLDWLSMLVSNRAKCDNIVRTVIQDAPQELDVLSNQPTQ